ncbi:MAG: flagellar hook protein FlgE [Vulcanimicrobiaceae bacterium]
MSIDSLFTGISGLNSYNSWINMISNNIANVDTVGFKGQRMTFADLFYQNQGFASGPTQTSGGINPQQLGLGVKVNTVDTLFAQGGLQTTGVNTDLALNGNGFFIMRNANGTSQPIYTRDGAFSLNSNGLLYDPASGLAVQGYMANQSGQITATGNPGNITIPIGLSEQATGTGFGVKIGPTTTDSVFDVGLGGNLDQTQWQIQQQAAASGTTSTAQPYSVSTTIYDSLGNAHQATLVYTPDASNVPVGSTTNGLPSTVSNANGKAVVPATRWKVGVYFADGTQVNGAAATSTAPATLGYAYFDQNGQFINTSSSVGVPGAALTTNVHVAGQPTSLADGNELNITQWGTAGSNNATAPTGTPTTGPIGLDFSHDSSLAGTYSANVLSQNGYAAGTLSNITVGQDGTITGAFTNGQQRALAQVALASFQNEEGLQRLGGNGFEQTAASGLPLVGTASTGSLGSIVSGALEQSNVSLANEFTNMIIAQRAFEANTHSIETADQNLQTVDNIRGSEN